MDVLTTAWTISGCPQHPAADRRTRRLAADMPVEDSCSRCGRFSADLTDTSAVVSTSFTAYDGWHDVTAGGLCGCCAWGYAEPALRMAAHLVDRPQGTFARLSAYKVGAVLRRPIRPGQALVVPLRPGRKHLLPSAVWGRVTVDDGVISWTAADADRLELVARFRELGFGPRLLAWPAPAWPVLRRLAPADRRHTMTNWPALRPWRARPQWLRLAIYASPAPTRTEAEATA